MTITKVLGAFRKAEQQENHPQGPDEAKQKTNIKTIQSKRDFETFHHRVSHLFCQIYM
jgi:hypothetical protein